MVTRPANRVNNRGAAPSSYPAVKQAAAELADKFATDLLAKLNKVDLTGVTLVKVAYDINLTGTAKPGAAAVLSLCCEQRSDGSTEPPGCAG